MMDFQGFMLLSAINHLYHGSQFRDRRGHDSMVVEFTTTYAISSYHH
jgi:hypothetical protein